MSGERLEPVRRSPTWERRRRKWYRESARDEFQERAAYPMLVLGLGSVAVFGHAWELLPDPLAYLWAVVGLAGCVLLLGLWSCQLWAGRVTGVLAAASALAELGVLCFRLPELQAMGIVGSAVRFILWFTVAVNLLGPSVRAVYRQSRTGLPPNEMTPREPKVNSRPRS